MFRLPAAIAAVLALSGPVLAENPIPDGPGVVVAQGSWTGTYVGLVGGYGFGDFSYIYDTDAPVVLSPNGVLGGVVAGFNWQQDQAVVGVEGDVSFGSWSEYVLLAPGNAPCFEEGCTARFNWLATLRGRIGYAMGDLMPYVTGGIAIAGIAGSADEGACGYTGSCRFDSAVGMTYGAGLEWSPSERYSLKLEYLYTNFGNPDFKVDDSNEIDDSNVSLHTARAGVNFHF